jgi:hypothetical protein
MPQKTGVPSMKIKYKAGTPCPSHEYYPDCLPYGIFQDRGFLVGCHGENISTYYDHPFRGEKVEGVLQQFGLADVPVLKLKPSLRKWIMRKLPHPIRRKLRFWSERVYNFLRS